jgi:hypothetical protein
MSENAPEVIPSVWDDDLIPDLGDGNGADFDWDAVIGDPPEWYYPLVGRVAVTTGGLERRFAQAALQLLGWTSDTGGDLAFWLASSAKLTTLLSAAKGLHPSLDDLARELPPAWRSRNEIVHVSTGWHDWDEPGEPSGWHYEHPRTGKTVYLDQPGTRPAMERALATIADLDQRVWELYVSLVQPSSKPEP